MNDDMNKEKNPDNINDTINKISENASMNYIKDDKGEQAKADTDRQIGCAAPYEAIGAAGVNPYSEVIIKKKWSPVPTAVIFVLGLVLLIAAGTPIQMNFGIIGVLATEILLLAFAFGCVYVLRYDVRKVFPIRKVTLRKIWATIVLWLSCFLITMVISAVLMMLLPEQSAQASGSVASILQGVSPLVAFLIISVSPAICEEALFRGVILSTLRGIDKKWIIMLVCGALFGIYHLNIVKFFTTGLIGVCLSYLLIETNNIVYPMLFHFVNNAAASWSVLFINSLPEELLNSAIENTPVITVGYIGIYLIIACIAPLLFVSALKLFDEKVKKSNFDSLKAHRAKYKKKSIIALLISAVMLVSGILVLIRNPILPSIDEFNNMPEYEDFYDDFFQDIPDDEDLVTSYEGNTVFISL